MLTHSIQSHANRVATRQEKKSSRRPDPYLITSVT